MSPNNPTQRYKLGAEWTVYVVGKDLGASVNSQQCASVSVCQQRAQTAKKANGILACILAVTESPAGPGL